MTPATTRAPPAPTRKPVPMLPGAYSRSSSPTATSRASSARAAPSPRAVCVRVARSVDMEDLLDGAVEVAGDRDRQRQGRVVAAGLDRVDRLPRDREDIGQLALGQPGSQPQLPDVVVHGPLVRRQARLSCQACLSSDGMSRMLVLDAGQGSTGRPPTGSVRPAGYGEVE